MGSIPAPPIFQTARYAPAVQLPEPFPRNTTFPLSLKPSSSNASLPEKIEDIKRLVQSGQIRTLLNAHGGIYFQDLNLQNADEFSQFAHAFGYVPHEDIGNPVRRTVLAKNVATANEGPNTKPVYPHNEFGLSPHYPAYVFFYCHSAPTAGGETPINNSAILYQKLKAIHPEFIDALQAKGVKYQLFFVNGSRDQTSSPGTTVLQAYGSKVLDTDDTETARQKIETEIQRLPTASWQWENQSESNLLGDLRIWQHLPAIRHHPLTGETAFFNNIVSRFLNAVDAGTLLPPHINRDGHYQPPAFYGDDGLIPQQYFETAVKIIHETRALVSWTRGDVVLLDNFTVQHAREPWEGERKLLASLWDEPATTTQRS
ncbi:hypothetical protein B0J11DRAFT_512602 [Dendryphion nanum]|uniref:TauD/TfdA-like domain-containing protein n=1 Tax=Dendryphion nanum TaxID=256645 RepID=A0A9P9D043_9PLEO|nr:hypothetical protein B0J11DRAFT_512602 [Dendryphion nanum]